MKAKISRGFKGLRKQMRDKGRYCADCKSCRYFYQDEGDSEESCHNSAVTKFDMASDSNRTYCTFWAVEEDR